MTHRSSGYASHQRSISSLSTAAVDSAPGSVATRRSSCRTSARRVVNLPASAFAFSASASSFRASVRALRTVSASAVCSAVSTRGPTRSGTPYTVRRHFTSALRPFSASRSGPANFAS